MTQKRRNHYDVTNRINVSRPAEVCQATLRTLRLQHPDCDAVTIERAFDLFARLYAGLLPGYHGCDTLYHDTQHSLDCTLALARLIDGHERTEKADHRLGARRAVLGVIVALFHDSGYIRRDTDGARNGAAYAFSHVPRGGEFLARVLPAWGHGESFDVVQDILHFTSFEVAPDRILLTDPRDRMLGLLLGTADLLAQTADRCYLEKCRDFLYAEFELCGLAGPPIPGGPVPIYDSREDLLSKTPEFNRRLWVERLDGHFEGVHRYMSAHFEGLNPYVTQIREHLKRIAELARDNRLDELNRRPESIGAAELRRILAATARRGARRSRLAAATDFTTRVQGTAAGSRSSLSRR